MRYSLRTLLIVMLLSGPALAGTWWACEPLSAGLLWGGNAIAQAAFVAIVVAVGCGMGYLFSRIELPSEVLIERLATWFKSRSDKR